MLGINIWVKNYIELNITILLEVIPKMGLRAKLSKTEHMTWNLGHMENT